MQLPPNGSKIKTYVEQELNEDSFVEANCSFCNETVQKAKKTEIMDCDDVKFIIVVFARGIQSSDSHRLLKNRMNILDEISLR